jgi:DNA-binding MarR family transcriptional regulator
VIVDQLADRSLVERRPCPHDGRVKLVAATPAGVDLATRCCEEREWLGPALEKLTPDQLATLDQALGLLLG